MIVSRVEIKSHDPPVMPRSKSIHFVQKTFNVVLPNDAQDTVFAEQVDLAAELSATLGHEIRQGQTFRVTGMQATIKAFDGGGDLDVGASTVVGAAYLPTNSHLRKAWNNVFQQWSKQKRLAGKVGAQTRFDDMEFAWSDATTVTGRTSTIYQDLADSVPEKLVLTGSSTAGTDFSLQDYYNSSFSNHNPSRDHFTNVTVKQPKAGSELYPDQQVIYTTGTYSAMVDSGATPDYLGNAISMNEFQFFPADNHINVACGLMYLFGKVLPPDTGGQTADEFQIVVTIAVEGWSPLVYRKKSRKPKSRKSRRKSRRSYRRR